MPWFTSCPASSPTPTDLASHPSHSGVKSSRLIHSSGSVYALPASEQAQEDFEWLLKEIGDGGGEAMICEARLLDGLSDDDVRALFNQARAQDYAAVSKDARALSALLRDEAGSVPEAELRTKVLRLRA